MGWLGRRRQRREDERIAAEELQAVIEMADEDTTLLGEQLSALGVESEGVELDEATRHDYQGALDAYEHAKRAVPRLASADEVTAVVDTLSSGRYLLACVRAGLEGRPRPELRPPCFFNPQHGPSDARRPLHGARWPRHPHGAGLRPGRRPGRGGREARDPEGTRRPERDAVLAGR